MSTYYSATQNDDRFYPALTGKETAKVCIVGGGFAGVATALGLLERGVKDVVLLESNCIGWGASGRNAGFCFSGYSLNPDHMLKQLGVEKTKQLFDLTIDAVSIIRNRIKKYSIACDLQDSGVMLVNWFNQPKILNDIKKFLSGKMNIEWDLVSQHQLRNEILSERYYGGLFESNAFHFHPLNYLRGIVVEAVKLGLRVYEQSEVQSVDESSNGNLLKTNQGEVLSDHCVICGGGYINHIVPQISKAILPISTYIAVTEPLGERLSSVIKKPYAVYDTRFAFDYYRPLTDTRLLWGGRISINQSPSDVEKIMYRDMIKVFPQLANVKFEFSWSGLMGYCLHKMPLIGRMNNIWYAIGFGGHGVAPTTAGGEIIASAIANNEKTFELFSYYQPRYAFDKLGLWGTQFIYWYLQTKDWLREKLI